MYMLMYSDMLDMIDKRNESLQIYFSYHKDWKQALSKATQIHKLIQRLTKYEL